MVYCSRSSSGTDFENLEIAGPVNLTLVGFKRPQAPSKEEPSTGPRESLQKLELRPLKHFQKTVNALHGPRPTQTRVSTWTPNVCEIMAQNLK